MNNIRKLLRCKVWKFTGTYKGFRTMPRAFKLVKGRIKETNLPRKYSPKYEAQNMPLIYTQETPNTLHFDAENLTEGMQKVFAKQELEDIQTKIKGHDIKSISFNFIHEDIFRCQLNMPIRKLGYNSFFQRYNDDKGLAVFFLRDKNEQKVDTGDIGAYNEQAFTKQALGLS